MIKKVIRNLFKFFGLEVRYARPKQSIRTNRLTFHKTITGNYFLPTDAKADVVANTIINNNVFEPEVIEIAKKYIRPGTVALDIGANFGQMSLLFSKMVGESGKVYSFDADDFVFHILEKNIEANDRENIVPIFGAVHNKSNETLYFPEQDFVKYKTYGAYGVDYNASTGRKIKTIKIDDLDIQGEISFMKIDIQGGDLQAMEGAITTIGKHKMPILFEYEYHFEEKFKMSFQQYVDFVSRINYKFERVINGHNFLILPK
jgi:FkbM family methyltransferase